MASVNIPVVAKEPVESPLSTPDNPIYFTRIERLLLEDGSTVFGCTECNFTGPKAGTVRIHLGTDHPSNKSGRKPPLIPQELRDTTLGELVDAHRRAETLMATVERQAEELAEWKARARHAERDLDTLHRVFNRASRSS